MYIQLKLKRKNKMNNRFQALIVIVSCSLIFSSCYKETVVVSGTGLEDWTTTTHSSSATPDYATVFNQNQVNRVDIVIDSRYWTIMSNNIKDLYGGTSSAGGGTTGGGPGGGGPPTGGGGTTTTGGGGDFAEEVPTYVPCSWFFNDKEWYNVGIRYKGNSSLSSGYQAGNGKLPFRIKFDYYANDYPEITGQTFYGFSDLSLSSNYDDESFMREKVATDLFREFGVAAPQSAFYELYVDYGEGPVYFGLYTFVEVIFDKMLASQFGSNAGNCYKPDGDGAAWSSTTFNITDFGKKTNEELGDWSDIWSVYDALHASTRTSNASQYQTDLEAVFDVDLFLKYLAVNNTIQNWDTYGRMTHNYYLYNDPATNLMTWIPWDNNEAFTEGKQGGSLAFELNDADLANWPLISYLIDIPAYRATYDAYIDDFINTTFEPTKMQGQYSTMKSLIQSSVEKEISGYTYLTGTSSFNDAVTTITNHASTRYTAASVYLN
jgi:spore coat protein CotH